MKVRRPERITTCCTKPLLGAIYRNQMLCHSGAMFGTITLPVWLFTLILLFAAVTAASHLLIPPVRWYFRRRLERAVARLNERLERPIQPFKLARRHDMIQRLIYDPGVAEAISEHAHRTGVREDVAFTEARRYAREIVPSFSASAYYGIAIGLSRWLSTRLYDVHLCGDRTSLARVHPDATVVFVMNHRSNMDYVLVTYLAADRSALSYAVGEWARIWPVSSLLRAMGAYFIRRRSRNPLYRRVLARYVQMAVAGGVTQAIFPEGALSLSGAVGTPRLGLLSYIVEGAERSGRDVAFVPVSLNYDRVLEDRVLTEAGRTGLRRFRGSIGSGTMFVLRWLWRRLRGQANTFGTAAVCFGEAVSLSDLGSPDDVPGLATALMRKIRQNTPVLSMPLVAHVILDGADTPEGILDALIAEIAQRKAAMQVVVASEPTAAKVARIIDQLRLRKLLEETPAGRLVLTDSGGEILAYYANSLRDASSCARSSKGET